MMVYCFNGGFGLLCGWYVLYVYIFYDMCLLVLGWVIYVYIGNDNVVFVWGCIFIDRWINCDYNVIEYIDIGLNFC